MILSPATRRIGSALCQATEAFADGLREPGNGTPRWSEFEWTLAYAAAVLHGVAPLLSSQLQWCEHAGWHRFAAAQFQHVRARHHRIESMLDRLHHAGVERKLGFVALKGAALHARGIYLPGQRPMADLDLLVDRADAPRMTQLLQQSGYHAERSTWKHDVFVPTAAARHADGVRAFGEHRDAVIKIELHTAIVERLPIWERDITREILPRPLPPGLSAYPSDIALLLHLLLHAAPGMMTRNLRLIHLHDIAALSRLIDAGEWTRLLQSCRLSERRGRRAASEGDPSPTWIFPPLQLAARYFPGCVPTDVLAALASACPRSLVRLSSRRSLAQLSYAQIDLQFFPGLIWGACLRERVHYLWRRLRPDREDLEVLALTQAEAWAQNSSLQLSRRRRVIRQLLLSPPRAPTMHVVRAAFAAARADSGCTSQSG